MTNDTRALDVDRACVGARRIDAMDAMDAMATKAPTAPRAISWLRLACCLGLVSWALSPRSLQAQGYNGGDMNWGPSGNSSSDPCGSDPGPYDPPPDCSDPCACSSCPPTDPNEEPADGNDWGDPHLVTLDHLAYDFQQVGEYVLISDGGGFVVQTRTAPFGGSSTISKNTAVAANVAGDRVGFYYGASEPLVVNGVPAAVPTTGIQLGHGGRVLKNFGDYVLEWPSGERVTLAITDLVSIRVHVPDRRRSYVGLLGTWDDDPKNDLVTRTGAYLSWPPTSEDVYGVFGDSWRVTPSESLFDYGPGEDTTTFTDESFPSHIVTTQTLPTEQFNQALDACVAAGVMEAAHLDGCILDVAASGGDDTIATAAAEAAPMPAVERLTFSGYFQNFEDSDDGHWSTTARFQMPAMDVLASTKTLGLVQTGETIVLTLEGFPAHTDVSVAFDLHVIGPWAGDAFDAAADGVPFTSTSFSNTAAPQKFPGQASDVDQPAQTAALVAGSLGLLSKAIYHQSYTFSHTATSLSVSFRAPSLPQGASFALDNVAVVTGVVGDPWDPKCFVGGLSLDDGNLCTVDLCDPGVGAVHTPRPTGTPCADLDLCNGQETCDVSGVCGGHPLSISDGNPCTVDSCDPRFGVVHDPLPLGTSCSDDDRCNGAESCNGIGQCVPGTPPTPALLPSDTNCDGVDDDCDGVADDDYVPVATQCGTGACAATGELACADGSIYDTCTPLVTTHGDFVCDGIDADCNGVPDDDFVPHSTPTLCGVGGCAQHAVATCVAGSEVETCTPGLPEPNDPTCDGVDDDCDGVTDENHVSIVLTCGRGPCAATGSTSCVGGQVMNSCVPGTPPSANDVTCDGVDDDCSGTADEEYVGLPTGTTCGVGACQRQAFNECVGGMVVETCSPGTPALNDATCDGIDDDCNGVADEEYIPAVTGCGVGQCTRVGTAACIAGQVSDTCVPGAPAANDATCDGLDDDCNGVADEDYPAMTTGCGVGGCFASGELGCSNGVVVDTCHPGAPAPDDSVCNGRDDDCDGVSDEDYAPVASSCGVGQCAATGTTSCVAGHVDLGCVPGTPAVNDVTCDRVDDDCNGTADEDYVGLQTGAICGTGACLRQAFYACVAGAILETCQPGAAAPSDTTCDGSDDDCDGVTDEDYVSVVTACGVGQCSASGNTSCVAGALIDDCIAGVPAATDTTCDGLDDDCDGFADDDYPGMTSSCGTGVCFAYGELGCSNGAVVDTCQPMIAAPDDTTCDGNDDDCDGHADDDYVSVPTSCGVGACGSMGATSCVNGLVTSSCVPGTPAASDASCDGVDDDCDGVVDEDFAEMTTVCGTGACAGYGTLVCSNGVAVATCQPSVPPTASDATCDAFDDDCDGSVDEDYVPVVTVCGVGQCSATGSTLCVAGAVVDGCVAGVPASADSSCDGIDDNCNGVADEDYPTQTTSCGPGACPAFSVVRCSDGAVVNDTCQLATTDSTCNGVDNDCDGSVDEDYASRATTCGIGACGATGAIACNGGIVTDSCSPGAPAASDTTCDGIDDDCNDVVDDHYASILTHCGSGACTTTGVTSCASGMVQDSCIVSCEGACGDMLDDDNDGSVDCADSDCANAPECGPPSNPFIGQPCTDSSQCGPGGACETALPGGYCLVPCDTAQPPGQECPSGATCWLGSACVLSCDSGGSCNGDTRLVCGGFEAAGLSPDPFCHPTCTESCVNGATCDPATNLCF